MISDEILEKFEAVIEEYERDKFTDAEREILHHMIDLWKAFEIFGKVANVLRNILIYLAGFLMLWLLPTEHLLKTVKKFFGFY